MEEEGTIFFGLSRIFKDPNPVLKKIVYLTLKELVRLPTFYMLTNSITIDAKEKVVASKKDALKLTPYIASQINAVQFEQLLRSALLDKDSGISNAGVMAAQGVAQQSPDHVKKCVNDIQDCLLNKPTTCHYHAINVLRTIKSSDMMGFVKILLLAITKNSNYHYLTTIQLIRYCREVIEGDLLDATAERTIFGWLAKQLNKNNTIVIEVAKTMASMRNLSNSELTAVVSSLQLYLLSMNPVNVFAALKIYDKLLENPARVGLLTSTTDIEALLAHQNKAVKSLALNVLLKVAREDKIAELLDRAYEIFADLPDSVKIHVITSCIDISRKFPEKTREIVLFLWKCLRDRGELDFKTRAIQTITQLMQKKREMIDKVYDLFCEYIEDPYSPKLVLMILSIFIDYIQYTTEPKKYLRFILNRIHLDESKVRAAAVTCLGEMGNKVDSIKAECADILNSYTHDIDDEVRERAFFYTNLLEDQDLFTEAQVDEILTPEAAARIQEMINADLNAEKIPEMDVIYEKRQPSSSSPVSSPTNIQPAERKGEVISEKRTTSSIGKPNKAMKAFVKEHEDLAEYGELLMSRDPEVALSHTGNFIQRCRTLRENSKTLL